jgi:hypothetical protein
MAQKAIKIKSKRSETSVSTSPSTVQYTRLGNRWSYALLASLQNGLLAVATVSIARACMCFHPLRELGSAHRCNRTIRNWKGRSGPSTSLIGLAVHEYHLISVYIHILMNNEFSHLVQSQTNQNSNNRYKSDSCPQTRLRVSPVTRLQSHKEPLGSRRRSYRRFRTTSLVQWQIDQHQCRVVNSGIRTRILVCRQLTTTSSQLERLESRLSRH